VRVSVSVAAVDQRLKWVRAAQELGLTPHFGPKYFEFKVDFHTLKHSLHPTHGASEEPARKHVYGSVRTHAWWAHGGFDDVEIIAGIPFVMRTARMGLGQDLRTVAIARIHPALVLGVQFTAPRTNTSLMSMEHPISAMDARGKAVIEAGAGEWLAWDHPAWRALAPPAYLHVTDSEVMMVAAGVARSELRKMLESVAPTARRLGEVRRRLPPSEVEARVSAEWRAFGAASNLHYDADSFLLHGRAGGFDVAVALYVRDWRHAVDLRARLARPFEPLRFLTVRRNSNLDQLASVFEPSVIRDVAFDRFRVHGTPKKAVRKALTAPIREAMAAVVQLAEGITLHHDTLWVHVDKVLDRKELVPAVAALVALANAFTPAPATHPYR
jgi:hypothetical protein